MIALCLVAALVAQDVPPPLPPPPDARPKAPLVDVDGDPLVAGRLPRSTTQAARETWERFLAATGSGSTARAPIAAFDLAIDLEIRANDRKLNAFPDARYAFQGPSWIVADTGRGLRQMRGPDGDWFVETKNGATTKTKLVGREKAEDRRQLDDALDVARLFTSLVDPRSVRVSKLEKRDAPPAWLPEKERDLAARLTWLELATPDVRPGSHDDVPGARMMLGCSSDDGLVHLALVDDLRAPRELNPTSVCARLDEWHRMDGYEVPSRVIVRLPETTDAAGTGGASSRVALAWRAQPGLDLKIKTGTLAAKLAPGEFVPPADAELKRDG